MVTDLLYNFILIDNGCVRDLETRFFNLSRLDSIKCVYPMYFVEEHQLNHADSLCRTKLVGPKTYVLNTHSCAKSYIFFKNLNFQ